MWSCMCGKDKCSYGFADDVFPRWCVSCAPIGAFDICNIKCMCGIERNSFCGSNKHNLDTTIWCKTCLGKMYKLCDYLNNCDDCDIHKIRESLENYEDIFWLDYDISELVDSDIQIFIKTTDELSFVISTYTHAIGGFIYNRINTLFVSEILVFDEYVIWKQDCNDGDYVYISA